MKYYEPFAIRPLSIRGVAGYEISFPTAMFEGSNSHQIVDETGKQYTLIGPEHFSLRGPMPEWYSKTLTFWVKGEQIGKSFRVVAE